MKISELADLLEANVMTGSDYEDREVTGCYIGDLLSWVMGRAKEGDVWITIMTNINVIGVAVLADVACVLIPEGTPIEETTIEKAQQQNVIMLSCQKSAYECAKILAPRL